MTLDYKEVARKAADELKRRGWMRVGLVPERLRYDSLDNPALADCEVCAVGALNAAVYGNPLGRQVEKEMGYTIFEDYPELLPIAATFNESLRYGLTPDVMSVFRFNDRQRRAQPVIDLFLSVE